MCFETYLNIILQTVRKFTMHPKQKYTVIYSFKILDGKENAFVHNWTELTRLIYEYEGSYGSRLHKADSHLFIGYAQWPDKETYDRSGNNLPETVTQYRQNLRACCAEIKTEYELREVQDLLKNEQHPNTI